MGSFAGQASDEDNQKMLGNISSGAPQQSNFGLNNANTLTNAYMAQQNGTGAQNDALGMMQQAALGQGPSVAGAQMNAGIQQAAQNAQSQMAANRGSGGLGMLNALNAGALAGGQAAGQGAVARAQEQLGNMANYGAAANAAAQTGQNALAGATNISALQQQGLENYSQLQQQNQQALANAQQHINDQSAQGFSNALGNIGKIAGIGGSIAGGVMGV